MDNRLQRTPSKNTAGEKGKEQVDVPTAAAAAAANTANQQLTSAATAADVRFVTPGNEVLRERRARARTVQQTKGGGGQEQIGAAVSHKKAPTPIRMRGYDDDNDDNNNNDDNDSEDEEDYNDDEIREIIEQLTQTVEEGVVIDYDIDLSQESIHDFNVDGDEGDDGDGNNENSIVEFDEEDDNDNQIEPAKKKSRWHEEEIRIRYGTTWRVMKKSEAYISKQDSKKIYVVDKFEFGELKIRAKCRIFQKIHHTFLEEEAKVLADIFPYVLHQSPVTIYVDMLGEKLDETPSSCLIYCEESVVASTKFCVTYKYHKNTFSSQSEKELFRTRTVLELFCGAGGMSEGFKQNGFHIKWAIDNDKDAISTFMYNHSPRDTFIYDECINQWFTKVKGKEAGYTGIEPDHIHASPPCQSFSKANRFGGKNDESNTQKTKVSIEIVEHFMPFSFSMENVVGLLDGANRKHLRKAMISLLLCGYQVRTMILNAVSYGNAQNRKRVFLFATKGGINLPDRPKETHGNLPSQKPVRVPRDDIQDLEKFEKKGLPSSPGIVQLNDNDKNSLTYNHSKESSFLKKGSKKLDPDVPVDTIRTGNGMEHYKFKRGLSNREYARLQSFPDNHRFFGLPTKVRRQIGNAVPCRLAFAVGEVIKNYCYPMM